MASEKLVSARRIERALCILDCLVRIRIDTLGRPWPCGRRVIWFAFVLPCDWQLNCLLLLGNDALQAIRRHLIGPNQVGMLLAQVQEAVCRRLGADLLPEVVRLNVVEFEACAAEP